MDHRRFWDTLSRQLQNKGPDYIARCTSRNKPLNTGDNVVPPAKFSQLPIQEFQEVEPLVKDSEEHLEKVRERIPREISAGAHVGTPDG